MHEPSLYSEVKMTDQKLKQRVLDAMENSPYKWRTVRGIASELATGASDIEDVLTNSGSFVRAQLPNEKGEALYSTVGRYKRDTPFLGRLFGAAANTVAS